MCDLSRLGICRSGEVRRRARYCSDPTWVIHVETRELGNPASYPASLRDSRCSDVHSIQVVDDSGLTGGLRSRVRIELSPRKESRSLRPRYDCSKLERPGN